jgi:ribosomal protein S18 acetylase RimI-like enzyme
MNSTFEILPLPDSLRGWANQTLEAYWGSTRMMSRWIYHETKDIPAFVAIQDDKPVGLATYYVDGDLCELVTLNSFAESIGVGQALLFAVRDLARQSGCRKLWLTTSNDNLPALQFYQKRDMAIVAVHRFAIDEARKENPHIPALGYGGIPCRDELELEMALHK